MNVDKGEYISANVNPGLRALSAGWNAPPIDTGDDDYIITFTLSWNAFAATAGAFSLEVSDDPVAMSAPASAVWNPITFPSGSTDGTQVTVSGTTATINANAGKMRIHLTGLSGAVRLTWNRTAGGTTAQLLVYYSKKRRARA